MISTGRREEVPAGTVLIQEGRPIDTLLILLEGTLSGVCCRLRGQDDRSLNQWCRCGRNVLR
jgi:hypothetical protein